MPQRRACAARGVEVDEVAVEAPTGLRAEIGTTFALHRAVAVEVREAAAAEAFPLVLSGNCGSAIGALAAAGAGTGIAWFDGHGDFNTPETSESGFTVAEVRRLGADAALQPDLDRVRAPRMHVHIDLDVHDPALAPANEFAPPDGLTPPEVQDAIRAIAAARGTCSASLAAYDPSVDPEGRALVAGLQLIDLFAALGC